MESGIDREILAAARDALVRARSVLFITGAGISAESGLPTYRGIGGLYDSTETEDGFPIEVALSGAMLQRDPALCWKHISRIEAACRGAQPNRAHRILAEIESAKDRCWVLTQNVDGLHRIAGSRNRIEIHGDVRRLLCTGCGRREQVDDYAHLAIPPVCPGCGGLVRPDVVLFGELLPPAEVARLYRELECGFDLVFSIGTSSAFPYIAEPIRRARAAGRATIEINPGLTEVSRFVRYRLPVAAVVGLEALVGAG